VNGSIEVDSYPESRVHNSQPHGIGRVVTIGGSWAWNNLGRNVVFAGDDLVPRALYDESAFADDEPSQYDLDVHAILAVPDAAIVVTLNHLGLLRAFTARDVLHPGSLRRVTPRWTRRFSADVERAVIVQRRIVGSRPREDAAPGLVVGEQLVAAPRSGDIETTVGLEMLGLVTALAVVDGGRAGIAVGADGHVHLVAATRDGLGEPSWDADVEFEPSVVIWDGRLLWAAGSERSASPTDDYDWEARRGGGFAALDPADGRVVVHGRFADDVAWGNGGIAVVRAPGALCAIGRTGRIHVYDERDGAPVLSAAALADSSLGIAHAGALGDRIVYGFNRGGYRLHTASVASLLAASLP